MIGLRSALMTAVCLHIIIERLEIMCADAPYDKTNCSIIIGIMFKKIPNFSFVLMSLFKRVSCRSVRML